jgi:hypothetical protein
MAIVLLTGQPHFLIHLDGPLVSCSISFSGKSCIEENTGHQKHPAKKTC